MTVPRAPAEKLSRLVIDLQEGFDDTAVALVVNGREVLLREHLTTPLLTGLAESIEVITDVDHADVQITIDHGQQRHASRFDLTEGRFIGLSLRGGVIESIQSSNAFGYG